MKNSDITDLAITYRAIADHTAADQVVRMTRLADQLAAIAETRMVEPDKQYRRCPGCRTFQPVHAFRANHSAFHNCTSCAKELRHANTRAKT